MTSLTRLWRVLIWGLAAILAFAIWQNWQDTEMAGDGDAAPADTSVETAPLDTGSGDTSAGATRPGPEPELDDGDAAEAAVEDAPDATLLPEADAGQTTGAAPSGDVPEGDALLPEADAATGDDGTDGDDQ